VRGQAGRDTLCGVALERGTILHDAYEITAAIGQGGMGDVYAARRLADGVRVAIKLLRPESVYLHEASERLRREAIAVRRISGARVAHALEVFEDPRMGIGVVFEYLEGETLEDRIRREHRLSIADCAPIVEQILEGLADAHGQSIIHRDLKPSNVFIATTPEGMQVKLLDFGVSKLPREQGFESLTQRHQNLGTFSYMAPEQIGMASGVDHRADLYACGVVVFRVLTGELPHVTRTMGDLILKKKSQPARRLRDALLPGSAPVPPAVEDFVARLLAMAPVDRYQSATEALQAWRAATAPARDPR